MVDFNPPISGDKLTNEELTKLFKCSPQGRMRRSLKTNTLLLISDENKKYIKRFGFKMDYIILQEWVVSMTKVYNLCKTGICCYQMKKIFKFFCLLKVKKRTYMSV